MRTASSVVSRKGRRRCYGHIGGSKGHVCVRGIDEANRDRYQGEREGEGIIVEEQGR